MLVSYLYHTDSLILMADVPLLLAFQYLQFSCNSNVLEKQTDKIWNKAKFKDF